MQGVQLRMRDLPTGRDVRQQLQRRDRGGRGLRLQTESLVGLLLHLADRVDLLLSRASAGEQTDRGRKQVGGQVRVDKAQMGGVWHLPRLRLLSLDRGLVDGLVWLWRDFPVLL